MIPILLMRVYLYSSVVLLSAAQPLPAKVSCSIRSPALCHNSNDLLWSRGFRSTVSEVIIKARKGKFSSRSFVPVGNIVEDIGQISQGVDVGDGYRVFYGSHQGNGSFRGGLAISDAGEIVGIAVIEPFSAKSANGEPAKRLHAEIYSVNDASGLQLRQKLRAWVRHRYAEERAFWAERGLPEYVDECLEDFYDLPARSAK